MERHGGDYFTDHQEFNPNSYPGNSCSWSSDDHRHTFPDNYYNPHPHPHRQHYYQHDQMNGGPTDFFGGQPPPFTGRKRGFNHPPDHIDSDFPAKLYVAPVPRTATEGDIRPLFDVHGNVIEVVLPRDKRTGQQQGYCFVKFMTFDEAGHAVNALNGHYIFPGEQAPIKVRFAGGERERPMAPREKLYVGCLSKQTSKQEIEEVFFPYGHVEDIFIVRDELKQSRGCAFVQFSQREMALAAIKGLHGTFTMRGSDQPLVVRFAEPKKPKIGEQRGNFAFGTPNFGPNFQEPLRPPSNLGDSAGGRIPFNVSYRPQHAFSNSQPLVFSDRSNQEAVAPTQQQHPSQQQSPSQLSQVTVQRIQTPHQSCQSSQQAVSEMQKQLNLRLSLNQNVEQQQNSQISISESPRSGNIPPTIATTFTNPTVPQSPLMVSYPECDWSEHTCPDGYKYYYNCETCESRWDKPKEYLSFEQQIQKQQNVGQQLSGQPVSSANEVAQTQVHPKMHLQEPSGFFSDPDYQQVQTKSSPVVHPTQA